ncbi:MAG: flagellar hook-associated protein 2 [Desulfobacteraceae bacterium Eth-SRB1]|nr:MAG: flagellar hook-associated protein 2 [Desulfobacteraceae bacterium Eth-SRB1]
MSISIGGADTSATAGTVQYSGLTSDTNWIDLVDQLMEVEHFHINRLNIWKQEWSDKITASQGLDSRLLILESVAGDFNSEAEFYSRTSTSSDEDVLTATNTSSATPGAHSVEVGTGIKHRLGSDGKPDKDIADYAGNGNQIQITVGGSNETITIDGGDYTLQGIASEINSESTLVDAEVINDGSGENEFRLALTAKNGGSSNVISISANNTSVDFSMSGVGDRIDTVEEGTWSGTSHAVSGGQYLGSTNKIFCFTVTSSGDAQVVGSDEITVLWTDDEGNSGDITFDDTYAADTLVDIFQGVQVKLSAGNVKKNDTFSIDIWHPDMQAAQDSGMAMTEKEVHSGFLDTDTTEATSTDQTFSYTYNGRERTIDIAAGTTLSELRDLINNDSENPGITAGILNDGSGLSTAYHLTIAGNGTGAAYKITSITHTLDNFGGTFDETQAAQNAMVKVDGYPSDSREYIQRSSNTISDLISGVTLSLSGTGTSTVSITDDTNAVKTKIEGIVDSINSVLDYINEMMAYDETGEGEDNGTMIGNYAFQIVRQKINDILISPVPGLTDEVDTYTHLSQIGIKTDPDQGGKWVIDSATLNDAMSDDLEAICNLFTRNETSGVDGIAELIRDETDKLSEAYTAADPGIVSVLINRYEEISDNIDGKIEREERRLALVENRLNIKFARLEVSLGQLQGQTDYLTSMLDNLPGIGAD